MNYPERPLDPPDGPPPFTAWVEFTIFDDEDNPAEVNAFVRDDEILTHTITVWNSEGGAETNTPELLGRAVDHFYEHRDDIFRKYTEG